MQSSEMVIEGEFLSHDQMVEKGFTEHFGKQVSTNCIYSLNISNPFYLIMHVPVPCH